jgi:hypothetical protein
MTGSFTSAGMAGKVGKNLTAKIKGMPHEAWIARIQASPYQGGSAWVVVNNYRKGDYQPYLFKTDDYGATWQRMVDEDQVRGYALAVVQDPQEPNLAFLGTEYGLWISIDAGNSWVQFKNGFPSVSTMDLKIQERESALIVGTFGRAIWVLDDLLSLREVAGKRLKPGLTALPMNEAVQVKGLFIAPPGNIWTGFHTTFEGENRVFQKIEVPYYLDGTDLTKDSVSARIYNEDGEWIQTVSALPTAKGLNYLIWKLDEQAATLPGAWIDDESRGIPVLPGRYKVVISCGAEQESSYVQVIPDPRFDLAPEVDVQLYQYQKAVAGQVATLAGSLRWIEARTAALDKLKQQLAEWEVKADTALVQDINQMQDRLLSLQAKGRTPRSDRQLGAWQTSAVTPYSKVNDARMVAMSRLRPISGQELALLEEAAQMVGAFKVAVNQFMEHEWQAFVKELDQADIDWLKGLK